jgi:hypothetical protein
MACYGDSFALLSIVQYAVHVRCVYVYSVNLLLAGGNIF